MIEYQGETYYSLRELLLWCGPCVVATIDLVEAIHAARRRPPASHSGSPLGPRCWRWAGAPRPSGSSRD